MSPVVRAGLGSKRLIVSERNRGKRGGTGPGKEAASKRCVLKPATKVSYRSSIPWGNHGKWQKKKSQKDLGQPERELGHPHPTHTDHSSGALPGGSGFPGIPALQAPGRTGHAPPLTEHRDVTTQLACGNRGTDPREGSDRDRVCGSSWLAPLGPSRASHSADSTFKLVLRKDN